MNRDPAAWARLGHALRTAREQQRLSQDQLADLAGVSTASVQSLEAGTVPKARMPITLAPVAQALGWASDAAAAILDGAAPPGSGWRDVPVQVQIDEETASGAITNAMVRVLDTASAAEIREGVRLAVDALRRYGVISETDGVQPPSTRAHP